MNAKAAWLTNGSQWEIGKHHRIVSLSLALSVNVPSLMYCEFLTYLHNVYIRTQIDLVSVLSKQPQNARDLTKQVLL